MANGLTLEKLDELIDWVMNNSVERIFIPPDIFESLSEDEKKILTQG